MKIVLSISVRFLTGPWSFASIVHSSTVPFPFVVVSIHLLTVYYIYRGMLDALAAAIYPSVTREER